MFKRSESKSFKMFGLSTPYMPTHLSEDEVLCFEMRRLGIEHSHKCLAKAKNFPTNGSTAQFSEWWNRLKHGGKKQKLAMTIMAFGSEITLKQNDRCKKKVQELQTKTKSQEDEISSLKMRLGELEKENQRQALMIIEAQANQKVLGLETEQRKEENKLLRQKHKADKEKITSLTMQLQDLTTSQDLDECSTNSLIEWRDDGCSGLSLRRPQSLNDHITRLCKSIKYLDDLPDLQQNNSNYEFWKKIKELIAIRIPPSLVLYLIKAKCPQNAWSEVEKNIRQRDFTGIDHTQLEYLLPKLRKSMTEALGPGQNLYSLFSARSQRNGESFIDYIKDKFRLFCLYGVDNEDPDRNDHTFICSVQLKMAKLYKKYIPMDSYKYDDMVRHGAIIDNQLMEAESRNECFNCKRKGHTYSHCRRPGGGAEVESNVCFTCGRHGHWARDC
ncbi:uncharacterized protein [Hoplias malabaricus]|uniref:uncharacterized protein n=1 Tax=Hoplias malabaricus TaxID=27720 RepID=UPI003462441F